MLFNKDYLMIAISVILLITIVYTIHRITILYQLKNSDNQLYVKNELMKMYSLLAILLILLAMPLYSLYKSKYGKDASHNKLSGG